MFYYNAIYLLINITILSHSSVPYRVAVEKLVQITIYLHFSGLQSRSRNFGDSITTYKTVLSGTNSEEEDKLQPNSDPETITHPVQTG